MFEIETTVIDELKIGPEDNPGLHMRLEETERGKRYVKLWSTLSKSWKTMYRYDVMTNWNKWKRYADLHAERSKD